MHFSVLPISTKLPIKIDFKIYYVFRIHELRKSWTDIIMTIKLKTLEGSSCDLPNVLATPTLGILPVDTARRNINQHNSNTSTPLISRSPNWPKGISGKSQNLMYFVRSPPRRTICGSEIPKTRFSKGKPHKTSTVFEKIAPQAPKFKFL